MKVKELKIGTIIILKNKTCDAAYHFWSNKHITYEAHIGDLKGL